MYRNLFIEAVEKQNVNLTEKVFKDCMQHNCDAKGILEVTLKNHLLKIIKNLNLAATQYFIQFSIVLTKKNLIDTHMPAQLISDTIDILPVEKCKDYFIALLDNKTDTWRDNFFISSRQILLRLCNKLLTRLSTVDHAIFRGQILIFLAKIFTLDDRSGCNVDKQKNTDYFQVKSEGSFDTMTDLSSDPSFKNFKVLQDYLRDPDKCITKRHWMKFMMTASSVLTFFLENDVKETEDSGTKLPIHGKVEYTDEFLRVSVYNCKFRRQILLQMLMIYQYLNSLALTKEQRDAIQTSTVTIHKILEESRPNGKDFLDTVKKILEREKRWTAWKSAGCPENPKPTGTKLNLLIPPKKRQLGDIWRERLAKHEESPESPPMDPLDGFTSPTRNFLPTLTSYLSQAARELQPESTVAEHDKKIYDGNFGWKALRLIAQRSNRFFDYSKEPIPKTADFLKMMIMKVLDAERDKAEEVIEHELSDEACASTINIPITSAEFEALFQTLGDDWKLLAMKLGFANSEIESIQMSQPTPSSRASCILRKWFEGPNNPSLEHFCTVMDSVGHPEISNLIRVNYLGIDTHEVSVKNEQTEIDEGLKLLNMQDVKNSPESLINEDD
ncbi:Hpr1 [Carabus blaptoides fortunei]